MDLTEYQIYNVQVGPILEAFAKSNLCQKQLLGQKRKKNFHSLHKLLTISFIKGIDSQGSAAGGQTVV